jgi:negative regulator of sigma E activity
VNLREAVTKTIQMTIAAIVTAVVIIGLLTWAFAGQTAEEREVLDGIRAGTLAQACILALPISETGRDPADVTACLRRYGLEP